MSVKQGKCVVLATHQLGFLKEATACFLMEDGAVTRSGSFTECIEASHGADLSTPSNIDDGHLGMQNCDEDPIVHDVDTQQEDDTDEASPKNIIDAAPEKIDEEQKEERVTGTVKFSTWREYAHAMGGLWVVLTIFTIFIVTQASSLVSMAMLGRWAEKPKVEQGSATNLSIAIGLVAITVFISIDRAVISFHFFNKASQFLHDRMASAVLFARISFFDTNSSGRLLNRFSADIGIADEQLPCKLQTSMAWEFYLFPVALKHFALLWNRQ
jgi:ATP-binding cassette subfamily C (CFTR/MRP) protein 4